MRQKGTFYHDQESILQMEYKQIETVSYLAMGKHVYK